MYHEMYNLRYINIGINIQTVNIFQPKVKGEDTEAEKK